MKKSITYHNTTSQDERFVKRELKIFKTQESLIMYFMGHLKKATASEMWTLISLSKEYPITSIRRGLSNLTHEGKLTKEDKTKIGLYGRPECYYTLNESK